MPDHPKKIFVRNLPYQTTEAELHAWLAQMTIDARRVSLPTDHVTGRPRGFGFIELEVSTDLDLKDAIALINGAMLGGRTLEANVSEDRHDSRGPDRDHHERRAKSKAKNQRRVPIEQMRSGRGGGGHRGGGGRRSIFED